MIFPLELPGMFAIFGSLGGAKALPPPPKTTASSVPCPGCIKTFPNKGALARHHQANPLHDVRPTSARPYQCETCKKTFPDQADLAKHPTSNSGSEGGAWAATRALRLRYGRGMSTGKEGKGGGRVKALVPCASGTVGE